MRTIEEFELSLDVHGDELTEAYEIFRGELTVPRKTLAARSADLAAGLRQLGLDESSVAMAVQLLALERRR
jgi:hypothetical protein